MRSPAQPPPETRSHFRLHTLGMCARSPRTRLNSRAQSVTGNRVLRRHAPRNGTVVGGCSPVQHVAAAGAGRVPGVGTGDRRAGYAVVCPHSGRYAALCVRLRLPDLAATPCSGAAATTADGDRTGAYTAAK